MIGTGSTKCATTPSPRDLSHLSSTKGEVDPDSSSPRFVGAQSSPPPPKTISESEVADRLVALLKREGKGYRYEDCVRSYLQRVKSESTSENDEVRDFPPHPDQGRREQQEQQGQVQGQGQVTAAAAIPPLNPSWRADICSWVFRVVDEHRVLPGGPDGGGASTSTSPALGNEIAIATMSYVDRYLASAHGNACGERTVLLACLAALRLATKLYSPVPFEMGFFLWVGRGQFDADDVEGMERDVLSELGWHVHPPTELDFAFHLVELLSCCRGTAKAPPPVSIGGMQREVLGRATRFLSGATTSDPFFVPLPASSVALAAVINAMEDVGLFDSSHGAGMAFLDRVAAAVSAGGDEDARLSPGSPGVQAARCRLLEMERAMYARAATANKNRCQMP